MKKLGKNKVLLMLLGVILVCFIVLALVLYKYFFTGGSSNKYGDRLNDIDKYSLSETLDDDIKALYTDNDKFSSVETNVKGKVIYINMEFKGDITSSEAQDLAIKALESIGDDNLDYYDVQFILTLKKSSDDSEETNTNFPVFGAKSATSNKVVW